MWLHAHFTMTLRDRHPDDISGEHRAVIELAVAMRYELDNHNVHPSKLREKQLEERVNKELKGGTISYAYPNVKLQTYSIKKGAMAWLKREKGWFSVIFITSLLCSTLWMPGIMQVYLFWVWTCGLWVGEVLAFCVGTTNGSRVLITLCWCIVTLIAMIPLLMYNR
jgi:hypothetical protein